MSDLPRGRVQTVCGQLAPTELGITLTHEHLFHEATAKAFGPRSPNPKYVHLNAQHVTAENQWWTQFHPYSHTDNLNFKSPETSILMKDEMLFYKSNGGSSVVEVTTFGKDLGRLRETSIASGVNIIAGAGYYVAASMPTSILTLTTEEIYDNIKNDLLVGENGIKCGVIGEVASAWPIEPFEKRVLQASAQIQAELNVPVIIHPGRNKQCPFAMMRLYLEAGGKAQRTVMSHLERTLFDDDDLLEFAKIGCYNEFDLFGIECSYYELVDSIDMPSDAIRINRLKKLIDEGYGDKIVISHDIHTKHRLMKFGGHGFSHILLNTVPKMLMRGYEQTDIDNILINNPRQWLTM